MRMIKVREDKEEMGRNEIREIEKRSERRKKRKDDRRGRGWEAVRQK